MQQVTFSFAAVERLYYGEPAAAALLREVERVGARRVFMMVSGTLRRETDEITKLQDALGSRVVGIFDNMPPFTPRDAVIAAANQARAVDADLIVTFGGGSLTDAGKIVQLCLRHNLTKVDDLEPYRVVIHPDGTRHLPQYDGPTIRQVAIPTTLSAGETGAQGGSLDPRGGVKQSYRHPLFVPRASIYDPRVTVHTPMWIWLSTGVRALDHAIELLCAPRADPISDGNALQTLRLLSRALPRVKRDPNDLEARLDCQFAAWISLMARQYGLTLGISHAIGHTLGNHAGVPHGYTSCVMLPPAMRYNQPVVAERHRLVAEAMGHPNDDAADVVQAFIADLGMPGRLADVGVGRDQFAIIAEKQCATRGITPTRAGCLGLKRWLKFWKWRHERRAAPATGH